MINRCFTGKLAPEVATKLYPHQKKALTFLLERERELPAVCSKPSSLWQEKINYLTGQKSWLHLVTQREVYQQPTEAKSAILADDVRSRFPLAFMIVYVPDSLDGTRQNNYLRVAHRINLSICP